MFKKIKKIPVYFILMLIYFYRACISPIFPACCRYQPTCSEYAIQALRKHGLLKGIILSTKRILRCHPFGSKGYDPVPEKFYIRKKSYKRG